MIKYSLRCADGHQFESWFANAAAFETLAQAGHLACALCGGSDVKKDIMAPRLGSGAEQEAPVPAAAPSEAPTPDAPDLPAALKALREKVERESDYVGPSFAKEARAMHEGTSPNRSIYGEAKLEDARKLIEDGVPVAPLPFIPTKKAH